MEYEERERQKSLYVSLQSTAERNAQIEAIVKNGERLTNEAGDAEESKASKLKGIRANRREEREQI